jgi:hypothetical protein
VAEMLAQEDRKHVLLIDLDPQTNATVTLISEDQWAEMDNESLTIAQLFDDRLNPHNEPKFNVEKAIAHRVSTINDCWHRSTMDPGGEENRTQRIVGFPELGTDYWTHLLRSRSSFQPFLCAPC